MQNNSMTEEHYEYQTAFITHPGLKRPTNEDFVAYFEPQETGEILTSGNLYIVADGVGGAAHGEQASRYAVQKVLNDYYQLSQSSQISPAQRLEHVIKAVNAEIYTHSRSEEINSRMATTIVAALIFQNELYVANVGDSRAYLIRDGQIEQLSRDHSLAGERIRDGSMTQEEARNSRMKNQLTRAIGSEEKVIVDISEPINLLPGDRIILCTDGLTRYASSQQILQLTSNRSSQDAAHRLIDYANSSGGADNTTVLVITIGANKFTLTDQDLQLKGLFQSNQRQPVSHLDDLDLYTGINEKQHAEKPSHRGPIIFGLFDFLIFTVSKIIKPGVSNDLENKKKTPSTPLIVTVSRPKYVPKIKEANYTAAIYPSNLSKVVKAEINLKMGANKKPGIFETDYQTNRIPVDLIARVSLSSPDFEFSEPKTIQITESPIIMTYIGKPKAECSSGQHAILFTIQEEKTRLELFSEVFDVKVEDYLFGFLSRPLLSRMLSILLSLISIIMYLLTFTEQIDKSFGLTTGTAGLFLAGLVFAFLRSRYSNPQTITLTP
jgi:serine/threonine protein phosphatase PrpC